MSSRASEALSTTTLTSGRRRRTSARSLGPQARHAEIENCQTDAGVLETGERSFERFRLHDRGNAEGVAQERGEAEAKHFVVVGDEDRSNPARLLAVRHSVRGSFENDAPTGQ